MSRRFIFLPFLAALVFPLHTFAQEGYPTPRVSPALGDSEAFRKGIFREKTKEIGAPSKSPLLIPTTEPEEKALLRRRRIEAVEGRTLLDIRILPAPRCGFGDLDLIQKDLRKPGTKSSLLITIEPLLKDSTAPPITSTVSLGAVQTGTAAILDLSVATPPIQYGLFICSDASGSNRCSGKPPMDFHALMEGYMELDQLRSAGKRSKEELDALYTELAKDKVYYFAYLLAGSDFIGTIYSRVSERSLAHLTTYLQNQGISVFQATEGAAQAKRWNDAVFSVPLDLTTSRLTIKLPNYDPEQCKTPAGFR
ncbi:MAG TPA: hypothetical protein PLP17_12005 [Oligoflexia bacterium]|nr:hypothetical protein [Oligoflexia bacterium]